MAAVAAAFAGKAVATSAISCIINKAFDHLNDNKKAGGLKSTKSVVFDAVDTEQIRAQSEELDACKVHKYKGKLAQTFNHTFNAGALKRLRSAVKTLDKVAAGVKRFLSVVNQFGNTKLKKHTQEEAADFRNWHETSSLPQSLVLVREKDTIVGWLTKTESGAPERAVNRLPIFSIVGIGGLGKTTLAQVICNDDKIKGYFDSIIWACVSCDFDVVTLTRKILQDVTRQQINIVDLNALHNELKEKLSSQTFLLVLDDVWNDDRLDDWEKLVRPLRYRKKGSKILLTTRMQSVADLAARAMQEEWQYFRECQSWRLSGLEETDLLVLLNRHAFYGINPVDYINLQQISKQMVGKLSGCPLAAKVLGGLLNSQRDSSTWNRGKERIMKVLRLSYQHIQTHLQACFRYCSLFHKNYEFTKNELVYLWMGSALIQHVVGGRMPEDVGMEYLDTLMKKSFFYVKSRPLSSRDIKCGFFGEYYEEKYVIHDLSHELAHSSSVKECVRVDRNFSEMNLKNVRHMDIEIINPAVVEQVSQAKKLRTIIMHFQEQEHDQAAQELILNKVLDVSKTLRVLSLTTNSTWKLPDELSRNLRHLQLPYFVMATIPYIGKMTSLHELCGFFVQQRDGYTIGELKNLKSISHLDVSGLDKVRNAEEVVDIMLDQKDNLSAISFSWSPPGPRDVLKVGPVSSDSCDTIKAEQLLDKLQPHTNSCKLRIVGYPGSRSPCWLEMRDLMDCNLLVLHIEDMPICTEWVGPNSEDLFPRLETLVVRDCKELRQLPNVPTSIGHIEIDNAGLKAMPLPPFLGASSSSSPTPRLSLSKLMISCCPNLATLWQGYTLPALEELSIQECTSLSYLPEYLFCSSPTLNKFEIAKCPNLRAGGIKFSPSLRYFTFGSCGDAETPLIYSLQDLKSLRRLFLDGCAVPSLPSEVFACLTGLISIVFSNCVMASLPSAQDFARLTNLEHLYIWNCKELVSLDGIQGLDSLTSLQISGCDSLVQDSPDVSGEGADLYGGALLLIELDIDHPSLLLKESLRSMTN
ncbi:hypothetical protein BS78_04G139700, partial [Paspalum vaginatum]